jgi:hypothetical protein
MNLGTNPNPARAEEGRGRGRTSFSGSEASESAHPRTRVSSLSSPMRMIEDGAEAKQRC